MRKRPTYAVIMAGGHGTRFWPASRRGRPKQFLRILGRRTMLQETVARFAGLVPAKRTLVVTGAEHAAQARRQAPGLPAANFLLEPVGRNTAPCIAFAAEMILRREEDAVMVCVAADHAVRDVAGFKATVRRAVALAAADEVLVTIGIRPTYAETGYGYIEIGDELPGGSPPAYRARGFEEKPDRATAEAYQASGRFLWNACMFAWRASVIRREIERHLPRTAAALRGVARAGKGRALAAAVRRAYRTVDPVAIDYGVMEKAERVAVVAGEFGWNDVGSWAVMPEVWGSDEAGNSSRGPLLALDARRNVVLGDGKLVALLGVDDCIVVDTDDALLVCHRSRAQDVRRVVDDLKRRRRSDLL